MRQRNAPSTPISHHLLSMGLAVLTTAALLAGVLGLAAEDRSALIASRTGSVGQAIAATPTTPRG